ncbi:hypothetical protein GCM10009075_18900 [Sphingomonas trueperi]
MRGVERQLVMLVREGLAKRVERAGTDVAEHDADGTEREFPCPVLAVVTMPAMRFRIGEERGSVSGRFGIHRCDRR